jgi:hypothetical protein
VAVMVTSDPTLLLLELGNCVEVELQVFTGLHVVDPPPSVSVTLTEPVLRDIAWLAKKVATLPTVMVQVFPF